MCEQTTPESARPAQTTPVPTFGSETAGGAPVASLLFPQPLPAPSAGLPRLPRLPRRFSRPVRLTRLQEACGRLEEIAARLGPGAKLPTVQRLCGEIGVSVATLNRALCDLEARGLIRRRHGVGIFVAGAAVGPEGLGT